MADFVAVIRRAVDGLADNTPENCERVYAKARGAVRRQLENMSPRPSDDVFQKQLDRLETAIGEVELEHTEALPAVEDTVAEPVDEPVAEPVEDYADEALPYAQAGPSEDVGQDDEPEPDMPKSRLFVAPAAQERVHIPEHVGGEREPFGQEDEGPEPASGALAHEPEADARSPFSDEPLIGDAHDEAFGLGTAAGASRRKRRSCGRRIAVAAVLVLVVAGAAYGLWDNRKSVLPMIASLSSSAPEKTASKASAPAEADKPMKEAEKQPQTAAPLPADQAAGKGPGSAEKAGSDLPPGGKYTQRLMPDGTETNPGPAKAGDQAPGEGRSVSAQTAEASAAPAQGGQQPGSENASSGGNGEAQQPAEISQKMYLYEERYKDQAPAAVTGSVVWSLAKDTSDASPSKMPVIHGEISVPEKGVTALVTIKHNNDSSLPASHLIEVVFALPGDFAGGGIQSVERVAMKQTEQARGDPLIAVPAKITDNFFMIALNDYPQAVKTNLNLLKTRNWIDIPLTYANGRRALITLEKGSSGAEVFDKALAAWAEADKSKTDSAATVPAGSQPDAAPAGQPGAGDSKPSATTPSSVPPASPGQ